MKPAIDNDTKYRILEILFSEHRVVLLRKQYHILEKEVTILRRKYLQALNDDKGVTAAETEYKRLNAEKKILSQRLTTAKGFLYKIHPKSPRLVNR